MKRLLRFDRRPLVATGSAQLAKSAVVCLAAAWGLSLDRVAVAGEVLAQGEVPVAGARIPHGRRAA